MSSDKACKTSKTCKRHTQCLREDKTRQYGLLRWPSAAADRTGRVQGTGLPRISGALDS